MTPIRARVALRLVRVGHHRFGPFTQGDFLQVDNGINVVRVVLDLAVHDHVRMRPLLSGSFAHSSRK